LPQKLPLKRTAPSDFSINGQKPPQFTLAGIERALDLRTLRTKRTGSAGRLSEIERTLFQELQHAR
jgi:hypothetical protein